MGSAELPSGRREDFPVTSFKRVEEFIGFLRRDAMARAARYANAMTPADQSEFTVLPEHVDMGMEFALRNPSESIIKMVGLDKVD